MYGVILIAAMTTSQTAPDLGWKGCNGCCGYNACCGCCGYTACCGCCGGWRGWRGYHGCRGGCCGGCCGGVLVVPASPSPDCVPHDGVILHGSAPVPAPAPAPAPTGAGAVKEPQTAAPSAAPADGATAKVAVSLPANGRLFVDGVPVSVATGGDTFHTPKLEKGQQYEYEIRAEVVVGGKVVSQTRRVKIGAGDLINADFSALGKAPDVTASAR